MFRFNSSPCRCRSQQTPVNRGNKGNALFKRKFLQQTTPRPKKRGNLPSSDRPQPAQQVCRELPLSNGEHFLSEDTSKKGRLYDMHRPKGYLSVHEHKSSRKYLCFQCRIRCYAFQGNYKADKTHSSLLAEKRYSNNCLPGRLPNPGFLHKGVKSKPSTNTRPYAVARFHHKLGEVPASLHSVIDIFGPLHRFTNNVSQSPREKDPEHTEQISKSHSQSHFISSPSGEPHRDIGSSPQAPLHYKGLQIQLIKSLQASRDNYETLVSVNSNAHNELQWWLQNIATVNRDGSTTNPPAPELYITSDVSKAGWGVCCQNLTANGRWSSQPDPLFVCLLCQIT